jgi:hypothetical protein
MTAKFPRFLAILQMLTGSLPPLATLNAAVPPKPHNGSQLIVVNDDGFSAFHSGRYKTAEDLRKAMLDYKDTQVAVMEWCMIAGSRANYPSKVTELIGDGMTEFPRRGDKLAHETLKRMADAGEHTLKIVADACHEAGTHLRLDPSSAPGLARIARVVLKDADGNVVKAWIESKAK